MQIIRDEKLVARRKKIGQIASLVGIAVLLGGMAFTWLAPNWDVPVQFTIYVPFLALLVGFWLWDDGGSWCPHSGLCIYVSEIGLCLNSLCLGIRREC